MHSRKTALRNIAISHDTDNRLRRLARQYDLSANDIVEKALEVGLDVLEARRAREVELADELRHTRDESRIAEIHAELERIRVKTDFEGGSR